jgi:selenide,water dikinase
LIASGERLPQLSTREQAILCDPQTSGGLLISVAEQALPSVQQLLSDRNLPCAVIGSLSRTSGQKARITVSSPHASD